jgi:hypothetical protein
MKTLVWVTTAAAFFLVTTTITDAYARHHRHHKHWYAHSYKGFGTRPGYARRDCWINQGPRRWVRCDSAMTGGA